MEAYQTTKGQCLCKKVKYEIISPLKKADNCHCSMCRKQHGAAFATYANFNPKDFRWLTGEEYTRVYETEYGAGWCFCSHCGSSLAGTQNGSITSIALGSVDSWVNIKPDSHIFIKSKAHWLEINDDLPQFNQRSKNK